MKIVTVNVPESYIEAIEKLVGENGFYPSRSELIREAARQFLIKEIKLAKEMKLKMVFTPEVKEIEKTVENDDELIKVPIIKNNALAEVKTYKVLRKMTYDDDNKEPETPKERDKKKGVAKKRNICSKSRKRLGNPNWERNEDGKLILVPKERLNF